MIKTWKNSATQKFADEGKSKFSGMDVSKANRRLSALNAAESLEALGKLNSVGLHKLTGDRKGQWAMTINGPWRVCFKFQDGNALEVEITDYH